MVDNLLDKASILLTPTAYNDGSMLSVKPNENLYGSELVTNGDFATDSDWTKQTSWSIGGGAANYDFLSDSKYIRQTLLNGGFVAGKTYKINFEITSGTAYMNINSNGGGLISLNTYSVGSYSIYVTPSISASDLLFYGRNTSGTAFSIDNVSVVEDLSGDFTFSRGSAATRVNEQGLVEEITDINLPRIDYSDGCGNWLLEEQSTNLITYSEDFSDSSWANISSSETSGFLAPNGQNDAFRFLTTAGASSYLFASNISVSNLTEYTISCYSKSNDNGLDNFKFYTSSGFSPVITTSNEWQRFEFTVTTNSTSIDVGFNGQSTNTDILIWGFQIEQQPYATSYIPTNGAIATRLADVATNSGNATLINSTEGALYLELEVTPFDSGIKGVEISDGSTSNIISLYFVGGASSTSLNARFQVGGTNVFQQQIKANMNYNQNYKIAFKWEQDNFKIYVDGVLEYSLLSGNTFGANILSNIDFNYVGSSSFNFYGKAKALAVYKEALTDAQLQSLTTI